MIPLWDDNPTKRTPVVTVAVMLACVAAFFLVQPQETVVGEIRFTYEYAAIPCEIVQGRPLTATEIEQTIDRGDETACQGDHPQGRALFPDKRPWLAVMTSMFLHGSLLHLGGNLLFLWVFGNNIEDRFGHVRYAAFYLASGVVATVAHILVQVDSTVPVVGASGAIAGVMGAYLMWFPMARVRTLFVIGFIPLWPRIPAFVPLILWLVSQFFIGPDEGIAWMAHVGGFAFGAAIALLARRYAPVRRTMWDRRYVSRY